MTTIIIANGAVEEQIPFCKQLIAVDGGLNHCFSQKLIPHLIIGDLDSASPEALEYYSSVPRLQFPRDKDKTDLEIALEWVLEKEPSIIVYGALGHRFDHTLYNYYLLGRYPERVVYYRGAEEITALSRSTILDCKEGQTVSFIPLTSCHGVTSKGLKWELTDATLDRQFMSISNVACRKKVEIKIEGGTLIYVKNNSIFDFSSLRKNIGNSLPI